MAGGDTVVPVTTSSGCYSELRIDHATDFCESIKKMQRRASFTRHKQSKSHKEAMHAIFAVPSCYKDCAEMLFSQHAKEKADNRHMPAVQNTIKCSVFSTTRIAFKRE